MFGRQGVQSDGTCADYRAGLDPLLWDDATAKGYAGLDTGALRNRVEWTTVEGRGRTTHAIFGRSKPFGGGSPPTEIVSFGATLQTSLVPWWGLGISTPTFTRATTAYVQDWEGIYRLALSGESRFTGARVEQNLLKTTSEDFSNAIWLTDTGGTGTCSKTNNYGIAPDGSQTAARVVATRGSGFGLLSNGSGDYTTAGSHTQVVSAWLKSNTGADQTITLSSRSGLNAADLVTITSEWKRFAVTRSHSNAGNGIYAGVYTSGDASVDFLIWHPMDQVVTSSLSAQGYGNPTNKNPGEYVSVGVESAPSYHGANVDGVKCFDTLNGNTVASNVVTEATGAPITSANSSTLTTDTGGPFGEPDEPSQANVLGTTAAIVRTMSDAGWVASNVTKGTATGSDGIAAVAASLTATAGNGTVLYTTVLGAAVRTFSPRVRRKTGTGTVEITGDNGATWTGITLTADYQPFVFTTASAANPVIGFRIVTSADAIEVDWNMLVAGAVAPALPIPLNVTTAADVKQYVSAGNVPTNNFTLYGESQFPIVPPAGDYYLWGSYVDANNSTSVLWDGTNLIARRRIGGTSNDATIALSPTAGTVFKWAARFSSTTGTDIAVDGVIGTNDATSTACQIGTNFQINADGNGAGQPSGTTRNVRIYKTALSSARLEELTA